MHTRNGEEVTGKTEQVWELSFTCYLLQNRVAAVEVFGWEIELFPKLVNNAPSVHPIPSELEIRLCEPFTEEEVTAGAGTETN